MVQHKYLLAEALAGVLVSWDSVLEPSSVGFSSSESEKPVLIFGVFVGLKPRDIIKFDSEFHGHSKQSSRYKHEYNKQIKT